MFDNSHAKLRNILLKIISVLSRQVATVLASKHPDTSVSQANALVMAWKALYTWKILSLVFATKKVTKKS